MRIYGMALLKYVEGGEPLYIGQASDVSSFGYFQRAAVQEMLTFVTRTIVARTPPGTRQSVEHEGMYMCHVANRNGLAGIAIVDKEYPSRSAFAALQKLVDDYVDANGESWRQIGADGKEADALVNESLTKFQDPMQADKLLKIQSELDETKVILHKTIDSVLARGEKLDNLVTKSADLSMASQMFYKQAKKNNQCCEIM
eukprot:CAMPEP_0170144384 /NCGR_PEP_ID=MMETSP0033_2-20121228/13450_1 /TAXON_ID=195969 /ORGANISM="Dolichomastix tenuilepis, Strain CCMP3274" /LENGTH=199 /DNA_ID=CAMNT_0010380879 /DNA_START=34 /DNA_END=633 /DNA_ORIENTATION=+